MLQFDWFGPAASEEAGPIDTLFDVMIVLSSFVFAVVMVMLGYCVWKYRAKPGDESDGEPIHGNTKLEIAWTVIPTVIVLFGAGYSWIVLDDIEAKADDRMPVNVTAQQFKWTFEYPEETVPSDEGPVPLSSSELHVPVDRQLELHLTALDVLHSFWVPEWRIKRDLVPEGAGGDEVDDEVVVTPERGGHLRQRLHRALRARALDDAGHGGGRVPGGVRPVGRRAARGGPRGRRRPPARAGRLARLGERTLAAAMRQPGLTRGALGFVIGAAFGFGLVVALRAISGLEIFQTEQTGYPHLIVPAITAPFGFLIGLGAFDYWFRWAAGRPTYPADLEHKDHGAKSWRDYFKFNTDHKVIGIQYIVTTFFFFLAGGLIAMLMRAELAQPGTQIVDPGVFNGLFSTHAALMIFVFVIPVFAGIANYVLPLMIGAPDMAFPRLNALSFWMLPIAGLLFLASFLVPGGAFDAGWTGYAPLSTGAPLGQSFFNLGVQFAGASSVATALNFLVTIITMRAPGMTFWRMPLLVWANLSTSLLVVAATPFIAGVQFMVLFDRVLNTNFFQAAFGGDVLSYQHIFWFYSHPAVYIMMLPGFGIVSEVISTHARKPIFGYRLMALALIGIVVLSYTVWAHHMFVSGMFSWLRVPMMITTLLIAVPTGIKIFSWLGTLFNSVLHLRSTAMLFALGFIVTFVIGGISGVMLGMVPIDIHVSDTYFIVAHIHFVLFGGSVFTIFAGIYHWFPKMTGRMYDEKLGRVHFYLTLVGMLGTFVPMHWVGMEGMPRRVADYSAQFGDWNLIISISAFLLGAAQLIFIYNMAVSWKWGPRAAANPWRAKTIEWQVSSPPPTFNFDEIPRVVGGPYEFGVPGARHAIMDSEEAEVATTRTGRGRRGRGRIVRRGPSGARSP